MSDSKTSLIQRAKSLPLTAIGTISGLFTDYTPLDGRTYEENIMKLVAVKALDHKIGIDPAELVVRDIYPDQDLLDGNGNVITKREWIQPVSGNITTVGADQTIYKTNKDSNNDQKVICFFGVKITGVGPGDTGSAVDYVSVSFDGNTKNIDRWHTQKLDNTQKREAVTRKPILYGPNDKAIIKMWPKTGTSGNTDQFIFLGKVAEKKGEFIGG